MSDLLITRPIGKCLGPIVAGVVGMASIGCVADAPESDPSAAMEGEAIAVEEQALQWNGHRYKKMVGTITRGQAKKNCEQFKDYHLVFINDSSEEDWLHTVVQGGSGRWWLGLKRTEQTGWEWDQSNPPAPKFTPSSYQHWANNEPSNGNDCAYDGEGDAGNGKWHADNCSAENRYICERDYQ